MIKIVKFESQIGIFLKISSVKSMLLYYNKSINTIIQTKLAKYGIIGDEKYDVRSYLYLR